ncbi:hypothetical protein BHM03_00058393 [Ensete ventricosum]|nr:hypothetical protein BHM03_00058393 [Ensete ventricosum]
MEKVVLECVVCLNELMDNEDLHLLLCCSHVFHLDFIDTWLSFHVLFVMSISSSKPLMTTSTCYL